MFLRITSSREKLWVSIANKTVCCDRSGLIRALWKFRLSVFLLNVRFRNFVLPTNNCCSGGL